MENKIKILGIAGSLRKNSYNKMALLAAQKLVPENAEIEIFDIKDIPVFNQDLENNFPEPVVKLKEAIKNADAILFVTPEYNYSIPGVLKNAIDWASRPYGQNAWEQKPAAIIGASGGALGTSRAQYHLRQVLVYSDMPTVTKPEVMIGNEMQKFDEAGNLTDEPTSQKIKELLQTLVNLTIKLKK